MVLIILSTIFVAALLYYLYKEGTRNGDYFKQRGIPYLRPTPFIGNSGTLMFDSTMTVNDFIVARYNAFPNEKAFGMWDLRQPLLMMRDPALIKLFAVEHAESFQDHVPLLDETMDELFGSSLFALKGRKWRDMRTTLSPAFTGSKMRLMFELVDEVCVQMMSRMRQETADRGVVDFEMKDICSRFTNDIIALCAFGIKVDSLEDRDNEFFKIGEDIHNLGKASATWKFLGYKAIPAIMRLFNIKLFGRAQPFFKEMVLSTMRFREDQQMIRPDLIHLLMEIRKGSLFNRRGEAASSPSRIQWTDNEIVAQCFFFLLAGLDTTSIPMSFAIYQLALDPDIQERLYEEVWATQQELLARGVPLDYEAVHSMKYLDQVVSETLRMHPPAAFVDRQCVKDCVVDDGDGFRMECTKELGFWIPIYALHRDPNYFPHPDRFDPERFSAENKPFITPNTYLPFGIGPRNCIGSRFGLMVVKALIYHLLINFSLHVVDKTQIPIKLKRSFGTVITERGIWVGIKRRLTAAS